MKDEEASYSHIEHNWIRIKLGATLLFVIALFLKIGNTYVYDFKISRYWKYRKIL